MWVITPTFVGRHGRKPRTFIARRVSHSAEIRARDLLNTKRFYSLHRDARGHTREFRRVHFTPCVSQTGMFTCNISTADRLFSPWCPVGFRGRIHIHETKHEQFPQHPYQHYAYFGLQGLTALSKKNSIFRDTAPCSRWRSFHVSGEHISFIFRIKGLRRTVLCFLPASYWFLASLALRRKMKTVRSSEKLGSFPNSTALYPRTKTPH